MKLLKFSIVLLLLVVVSSASAQPSKEERFITTAKNFFQHLEAKEYDKCELLFDSSLSKALDADKLKKNWEPTREKMGALIKREGESFEDHDQYSFVYLGCKFELSANDIKVAFNPAGKILGFFIVAPQSKDLYHPPSYAHLDSVIEREVQIETDTFKLGGTLMIPKNVVHPPIVVLVHGSGPNDRDETYKSNKVFKDVAYALASAGIASLRYDKRTFIYGIHAAGDYQNLTPKEETVDDALSALKLARSFPETNSSKVFLLGHSLGAMMAPRIAEIDAHLSGVIMMAAPARHFEDVVLDQMEYLYPQQTTKEDAEKRLIPIREMVARIKTHHYTDTTSPELLFNLPPKYWDYLRGYEQVKTASTLTLPMLLLQGDQDYQVSLKEYNIWKQALGGNKNVTFMMFPGLFHLFMPGKGTYTDYDATGHVSTDVTSAITKWVNAR